MCREKREKRIYGVFYKKIPFFYKNGCGGLGDLRDGEGFAGKREGGGRRKEKEERGIGR